MLNELKLQPLKDRRRQNRLTLFYKGLTAKANMPINYLETPRRRTRHMHEQHFKQLYASTDTYKFSFIPRTVKDGTVVAGLGASHHSTQSLNSLKLSEMINVCSCARCKNVFRRYTYKH